MNRNSRIKLLTKIAKKQSFEGLSGQHSRKNVEKHLAKMKQLWSTISSELAGHKQDAADLASLIEEKAGHEKFTRDEMKKCHDILSCMDFASADDVRIKGDEVTYGKKGKVYSRDPESGDFKPYVKPKKEKKEDKADVNDANDGSEKDDLAGFQGMTAEELAKFDGVDITK